MNRGYPWIADPDDPAAQSVFDKRVNLYGVFAASDNTGGITVTIKDPQATGGTGQTLIALPTGESLNIGAPGVECGSLSITLGATGDQCFVSYDPLP